MITTNPQRLSAKPQKKQQKTTWLQSEHKMCMRVTCTEPSLFLKIYSVPLEPKAL